MDVVKEDMELIGVGEEGEMEAGDWLWPSPKENGQKKRKKIVTVSGVNIGGAYFTD